MLHAVLMLLALVFGTTTLAGPLPAEKVPEPLKPWIGWVLHGQEDQACPFAEGQPEARRCVWPSRLELNLDERTGRFVLAVAVSAEDWVSLPGDSSRWPQGITLDGKPTVVAERNGKPALRLLPGTHTVSGGFVYDRLPENFPVPEATGIIALTVHGRPVGFPAFNTDGQLWIHDHTGQRSESATAADTLSLRIFRHIIDGVPLEVITRLDLDVSGKPREILLSGALLADFIPLRVISPLSARLEADQRLRVQLRPGRWSLEVVGRHAGPVDSLQAPGAAEPWAAEEIWAFEARPQIRLVEIEGVPSVDPNQTELPEAWKSLPAYRLEPGQTMAFKTLRRGDPEPQPDDLNLQRRIWLDFDGRGYTVNDHIAGRMSRDWRLDVLPALTLGRVAIDGEAQPITREEQTGGVGIEVRHGALDVSADSRMDGRRSWPAAGWNKDFRQVSAELNLPPGWRLFTTTGADSAPGAWTASWTLLDLFVVLITALAVTRLWNWQLGALALVALALLWQEPGAPRYVWLNLLAAIALLRVLPEGRFAAIVRVYRNLAVVALVLVAIPFLVGQIRLGLYPQLEQPWPAPAALPAAPPMPEAPLEQAVQAPAPAAMAPKSLSRSVQHTMKMGGVAAGSAEPAPRRELRTIDPNAVTQTGPGLPEWQWNRIPLTWNGPVLRGQEVGLVLLSPAVNLLLNLLRVLLLLALAGLLVSGQQPRFPAFPWRRSAPLLVLPLLLFVPRARADFPDPAVLEELRSRLLAAPDCQPQCAEIQNLKLDTSAEELQQTLNIHTLARVAVPLPAQLGQWWPAQAEADGKAVDGLFRSGDGRLWLLLAPGRHTVVLTGPLPSREQVQLPLPLKPHRAEATGGHWRLEGIRDNDVPDVQLRLIRIGQGERPAQLPTLEARPLPPFLEVQRTLRLGLDWQVATMVRRLSPADSPVSLEIPLIPGESVVSAETQVRNGRIAVNLLPGQTSIAWESVLEKQPRIRLEAPKTQDWAEIWRADVSPIWHVRSEGLVVVHHANPQGNWLPEWRPWAGESVELAITRPTGVPGNTLTIDRSEVQASPGARATDASLTVVLRSSQGGQHVVRLPEGTELQSASLDGRLQPIRQQGRSVSLPLRPGTQTALLSFRNTSGIGSRFTAPDIDLGAPSVNASVRMSLGQDRWVLLAGGPRLGPAVLFWGILATILLLSPILARIPGPLLKTRQWALLLIGLSQIPVYGGMLVVGWLLALGWRVRFGRDLGDGRFNAVQIALGLLTLAALAVLLQAVEQGLLGLPSMQIAGNGSDAYHLNWYQDRSGPALPRPWLVSVPLWVYRVLMLAWALWLAYSLLDWLRWGWGCWSEDGLWRPRKTKVREESGGPR